MMKQERKSLVSPREQWKRLWGLFRKSRIPQGSVEEIIGISKGIAVSQETLHEFMGITVSVPDETLQEIMGFLQGIQGY